MYLQQVNTKSKEESKFANNTLVIYAIDVTFYGLLTSSLIIHSGYRAWSSKMFITLNVFLKAR